MDLVLALMLPPLIMWAVLIVAFWQVAYGLPYHGSRIRAKYRSLLRVASVMLAINVTGIAVILAK